MVSILTKSMKRKMLVVGIFLAVICALVIILRLFYLQVYAGEEYRQLAEVHAGAAAVAEH